ncbi:type II toxin-antitoxin system toxin TscT [Staphylococcus caeli]|uniref:Pathogenicity island protein n=1 Tax=Staphylococcus caeli TaxID=2201815 RepID=A0A1D4PWF4_9STAP|nr:DUF1474 family protein [Staphylococcus caeli]SCT27263.1 pathogenicity island protein [Staphylococcus caeli]SCT34673.1 pathogenicity island protein [Staphylococcus caeli]
MNWNKEDLLCEFEVLKDKINDVLTAHTWHGDDMYRFKDLTNNNAREHYVMGYIESRIQHEQTTDLLTMYLERFDSLTAQFSKLLEKEKNASPQAGKQNDDAQNKIFK